MSQEVHKQFNSGDLIQEITQNLNEVLDSLAQINETPVTKNLFKTTVIHDINWQKKVKPALEYVYQHKLPKNKDFIKISATTQQDKTFFDVVTLKDYQASLSLLLNYILIFYTTLESTQERNFFITTISTLIDCLPVKVSFEYSED